jgi:hypothetical protein
LCIEYDGQQHFNSIDYWGGENALKENIEKDNIKNEYCKENGINLIRISYKDDIANALKEKLF